MVMTLESAFWRPLFYHWNYSPNILILNCNNDLRSLKIDVSLIIRKVLMVITRYEISRLGAELNRHFKGCSLTH